MGHRDALCEFPACPHVRVTDGGSCKSGAHGSPADDYMGRRDALCEFPACPHVRATDGGSCKSGAHGSPEEVPVQDEENWGREEENCSAALHEPSEEETVADTEGNKTPLKRKTHKQGPAEDGASSRVTTAMHFSKEPSEEETVADTEGNKTPLKRKTRKQGPAKDGASSGVTPVEHFSKGKAPHKRKPWQPEEVKAVERHMKVLIRVCTVPSKRDCEKFLRAEPEALKNRDWQNVKFFVYNRITAYKRKMLLQ